MVDRSSLTDEVEEAKADFALVSQVFQAPWSSDEFAPSTVYARGLKNGPARLADVRGWGYLTGGGHGALGLNKDEAARIQDAVARLIAGIPTLLTALEAAQARAEKAEASLVEAMGALEPFAEACAHLHPSQPDDGVTLDGFTARDFRRASDVHSRLLEGVSGEGGLSQSQPVLSPKSDPRDAYGNWKGPNHPEKGAPNGRCNRTACQHPLAHEPRHQFMDGNHTGGPRLHYCASCALKFDEADRQFREPQRIKRELKASRSVNDGASSHHTRQLRDEQNPLPTHNTDASGPSEGGEL